MTETEWLACTDPRPMIGFLGDRPSTRKLRLFACACCRTQWDRIEDEDVRKAIEAAERYADGLIRDSTVTNWYRRAARARNRVRGVDFIRHDLYQAVIEAALPDQYRGRVALAYWYVTHAMAHANTSSLVPTWNAAREQAATTFPPYLREIIGNPFRETEVDSAWLAWNDGTIPRLAQAIYDERAHDRLPILGDALEDAGCTDAEILSHCRGAGPHVRGCWVVDLLLGRA
jgi:hypothetical protein